MARALPLGLIGAAGLALAACSSGTAHPSSAPPPRHTTQLTATTLAPSTGATATVPDSAACLSGTVTVRAANPGEATPVCATVGSRLQLSGGDAMSAGTWPGPPQISDHTVLALLTSAHAGVVFNGTFTALRPGTATVTVPFVAGPDVCNPTPCTPVPGAPLYFDVKVVAR